MKAIVLLCTKKNPDDSEEYVNAEITKVKVTIEGNLYAVYSDGLHREEIYNEAKRFFGKSDDNDNVSCQDFYKNKYAVVVDLRTVDDETVVGSGRKLIGTQSGILLEVEKEATADDLECSVFVIFDGNFPHLGMTGCGKTYYLLEMLEQNYKNHFEQIFLICPTFEYNATYQNWKFKNDDDVIAIPCKQDQVVDYLQMVTDHAKGTNSLIILDDCASSKQIKNRTGELINLAFHARHYGLSTIVITQQLTSISKPYRENISKLVTFYNPSSKDMEILMDEYMDIDNEEKKKLKKF